MATYKALVYRDEKRKDGTFSVRIRVTHNRKSIKVPTGIYIAADELSKNLKIKNQHISDKLDDLIRSWRQITNMAAQELKYKSVKEVFEYIQRIEANESGFRLNFIEYGRRVASRKAMGTGRSYDTALNALLRFAKSDFDIGLLTARFLEQFEAFLRTEPGPGKEAKSKANGRAISLYMSCLRHIHNEAKREYNDEDVGIINIPRSPFKKYVVKPTPVVEKRAVSFEVMQQIISLPDGNILRDLARDCFVLSFGLAGMNKIDMLTCLPPIGDVITYYRQKTTTRRVDKAKMKIRIEPQIAPLVKKYRDTGGERLFKFHKMYSGMSSFETAMRKGMLMLEEAVKPDRHITFYSARHSWATIARSRRLNIDKYTVHEALNHVDEKMKVTDMYVERDWSNIWEANSRVLELFDFIEN
ncbi:MAG: site-specific integrase [Prevotellaceae bacterium]|jgi:integrase|nr:site-specific integrase [Prevotellaceae bacterium]